MKKYFRYIFDTFFGEKLELRVKMFHVLAITGILICISMAAVSLIKNMMVSAVINVAAGIVSFLLLCYSAKKKNYQFCYLVSIVMIFFILFPSLFFAGGGYLSGMPSFFIFAVVFTIYMLDGWLMAAVSVLELAIYSALCIAAYHHPDWVIPFSSQQEILADVIIGFVVVSISLGATMFIQIRMYRRQQKELKRAQQEADAANRAKSAFLANMSHEIRTPIHMILGMNEIILRESRGRHIMVYSEKIDETSKMLLSLVDSILDVSKIESGKMEIISSAYDSMAFVKNLALIGSTHCSKKKLSFSWNADQNLPRRLEGDLPHIQQIATNLISNAAKYTNTGGVTLSVFQEQAEKENQIMLCISVEDTGIGIARPDIPTLFEAFTRADLASHRHIAGTGLGLAIVKNLVDLMGGTIQVDSNPGDGSRFLVKLPQIVLTDQQESDGKTSSMFLAPEVRMLVVDDNEGNRTVMRELLRPTLIQLDAASSGQECLQMVQDHTYHLILMDYMMPEMDGLETMNHLKQMDGFSTPVLALTADATVETRQRLKEGGFASCLTKPIPWAQMCQALISNLPPELVRMTECMTAEPDDQRKLDGELLNEMESYGVSVESGLQYFSNNLEEYAAVAQLFLNYAQRDMLELKRLTEEGNCEKICFIVHALKGKARNLGIGTLADVSAYAEKLCSQKNREEFLCLMPYLEYMWKRSVTGLNILLKRIELGPKPNRTKLPENCNYLELLPRLLREFRRRPSLDCLDALIDEEHDPAGKEKLTCIAELVSRIAFEQAEEQFEAYKNWKEGRKT